ncbi:hypothetical protein D3C71_2039530 [compost metagenome]
MKPGGLSGQCGGCLQQRIQRSTIDPVAHVEAFRDEAPAMQEVGEVLQGINRLLIEFGAQTQVRVVAISGADPVLATVSFPG